MYTDYQKLLSYKEESLTLRELQRDWCMAKKQHPRRILIASQHPGWNSFNSGPESYQLQDYAWLYRSEAGRLVNM